MLKIVKERRQNKMTEQYVYEPEQPTNSEQETDINQKAVFGGAVIGGVFMAPRPEVTPVDQQTQKEIAEHILFHRS